jgi:hypothetical protein
MADYMDCLHRLSKPNQSLDKLTCLAYQKEWRSPASEAVSLSKLGQFPHK